MWKWEILGYEAWANKKKGSAVINIVFLLFSPKPPSQV